MSKLKSGRIILDEGASTALSSMYDELKSEACIKITPSKLSSWIIAEFQKSYFKRYKKKITKEHFNSKEYLKAIISNVDENENLEDVLRQALSDIKSPKQPKANAGQETQERAD
jgi:hypothetical protein